MNEAQRKVVVDWNNDACEEKYNAMLELNPMPAEEDLPFVSWRLNGESTCENEIYYENLCEWEDWLTVEAGKEATER